MKSVKKYTTFEDLKSNEKKTTDYKIRLKKHAEFEKFISSIIPVKHQKKQFINPNKLDGR